MDLTYIEYLNWLVRAYADWMENVRTSPESYTLRWKRKFESEIERIAIEMLNAEC